MNIIEKIHQDIKKLQDEIDQIQKDCSHPSVTRVGRGDSGNILTGRDPSSWFENTCNLCMKKWDSDK